LFKAGEEALLAGNVAGAVDYWKTACRIDPQVEAQLVDLAAGRGMPLAFFVEQFQPQLSACRLLGGRYHATTPPAEFQTFLRHYLQTSEAAAERAAGPAAGRLWLESYRLSRQLPDTERAWQNVQQALKADPNSLEIHRACGDSLLERQEYAEAEAQFKWCLLRQPGDAQLKALVASAIKQRIDAQTQNTSRAAAGLDRTKKY
jgi:tetratricopeptide (TPR) repeat protein